MPPELPNNRPESLLENPKDSLRKMTESGKTVIPFPREQVEKMSSTDAAIILAVSQVQESQNAIWDEVRGVKNHLEDQDDTAARIEEQVKHTNGTVREHEADLNLLKEKERVRSQAEFDAIINNKIKAARIDGIMIIPRYFKKYFLLGFGALVASVNWDHLINIISWIYHLGKP